MFNPSFSVCSGPNLKLTPDAEVNVRMLVCTSVCTHNVKTFLLN